MASGEAPSSPLCGGTYSHAAAASDSIPDVGDELGRMAEALCLEAGRALQQDADTRDSLRENQSAATRWPPGAASSVAGGAHRKARSLDYREGSNEDNSYGGTQQGQSQTPQTRTPNTIRPCTDCQWGSTGLAMASPGPVPRRVSPGQQAIASATVLRRRVLSHSSTEEQGEEEEEVGEEEEEEDEQRGGSLQGSPPQATPQATPLATPSLAPTLDRRLSKRERNRLKILRRKQRRRERWIQSQLQEHRQSSTGNATSSSEDEDVPAGDREGFICAVCLDVYFSPYMCHPCNHVFCEPCLRTLAKNSPSNTPCPLCRTVITHVFFQKELNQTTRTFFPKEYLSRKQTFQRASCSKWPLPSCRKLFRIFGGFRRQASPITRRQFPHGGYRLDALDFEDDSRGWRFDMDMVIIYIYSVNWVIGFIVFCFLCYFFFPSF